MESDSGGFNGGTTTSRRAGDDDTDPAPGLSAAVVAAFFAQSKLVHVMSTEENGNRQEHTTQAPDKTANIRCTLPLAPFAFSCRH